MMERRPAWSSSFTPETLSALRPVLPLDDLTPEWAWGGSTGRGVKVGVIDSGIDADHPAVGRGVQGYVTIREGAEGLVYDRTPHGDDYGHGTACAGIIRTLAPDCDLYSIKVLGADLHGRGAVFVSGLAWAIENGMQVCNLSLGSTKKELYGVLHELTDLAYFRNTMLVTAANNLPVASYPAMYASVISVAAHGTKSQDVFYYNPRPPVEFGAPGIDVHVAWYGGGWTTATGNSFAAAHMTGWVAKVLGKHADLTAFQMKAVLQALSANMTRPEGREKKGGAA
jgi:subtilisin family serine protease